MIIIIIITHNPGSNQGNCTHPFYDPQMFSVADLCVDDLLDSFLAFDTS